MHSKRFTDIPLSETPKAEYLKAKNVHGCNAELKKSKFQPHLIFCYHLVVCSYG